MGGLGQGYPGSLGFQAGASDQPGGFGGFGGMGQGIAPMAGMSLCYLTRSTFKTTQAHSVLLRNGTRIEI